MKSRILWLVVVLAAIAGFYYTTIRPALTPSPRALNRQVNKEFRPADIPPPPLPEPKIDIPALRLPSPEVVVPKSAIANPTAPRDDRHPSQPEVPIQNGATIDFSIGAPVVRSQGEDQAALDKALKEMAEATKDVTFPPPASPRKN